MGRQSPEPWSGAANETAIASQQSKTSATPSKPESRAIEALKQLFCGGAAGSVAKTVTAPLSRLTILYQVHPMVTTKEHRPKFSMTIRGGISKIVERGGVLSLWKGNGTSVLHRFPFSAINFYVYEGVMDLLNGPQRLSDDDEDDITNDKEVSTFSRLFAGVVGLYAGLAPTLMVAVPNFSISWMVYGSLKEYALEDELFYNLRKVDAGTGEEKLGFLLTLMCGAASGTLSTWVTFPFDTNLLKKDGIKGFYRGIAPEVMKVIPMVGTMFTVYEYLKDQLLPSN
ncbi:mitochondrial carrier protein [Skeletonema marinoi]|uniref:Mitochondrial carrier protein n=1 Tax=Skeletonema marinoi TaxID=267567 RepID=A0AAD8YNW8_9STRA|nr:mitochondrial carrier protein [Skeletonema marinoi]